MVRGEDRCLKPISRNWNMKEVWNCTHLGLFCRNYSFHSGLNPQQVSCLAGAIRPPRQLLDAILVYLQLQHTTIAVFFPFFWWSCLFDCEIYHRTCTRVSSLGQKLKHFSRNARLSGAFPKDRAPVLFYFAVTTLLHDLIMADCSLVWV